MAVIRFTDADKLAGKTMEKGGYPLIISEIEGPKASASQKSVSYFVTFRVAAGKFMGKELKTAFNSETRDRSVLGTMQWFPTRDFMLIAAAQQGKTLDEVDMELDTDALLNKPFDSIVDVATADGNLINVILSFLPAGKGTGSVPF